MNIDNSETGQTDGGVDVIGDDGENFTVNFGEVKDAEALPKNTQVNLVCVKNEFAMSKSSNKPMWNQSWEIEDGEYAGQKIFNIMSFSEKALPMTKSALKVLGLDSVLSDPAFSPKKFADDGHMLGVKCSAKTKIEPYEGRNNTRIGRWMPAAAGSSANAFLSQ